MELRSDWSDWFACLNANEVEYIVVGAFAVAHYGLPRLTGDIDVLLLPEVQNVQRLLAALDQFGFSSLNLMAEDFMKQDNVIQLGRVPGRIDIMTSISGVSNDEAFSSSVIGMLGEQRVRFISLENLLRNKSATGRTKDLQDVEQLKDLAP